MDEMTKKFNGLIETAGDFTKRVRTQPYDPKWKHTLIIQTEDRDELCDRLDRAEAINKDLLEACEYSHTYLLRKIGQATHAVALLEAAIAKVSPNSIKRDGTTPFP